jgi:metallophosphoesterase superfamily enzyme
VLLGLLSQPKEVVIVGHEHPTFLVGIREVLSVAGSQHPRFAQRENVNPTISKPRRDRFCNVFVEIISNHGH